ncbi:MAG: chemotaxis protein CheX [Spirochaetia bacterium]|nr:chemotaxis protein CheX [Spirochaetia bacterium]
MLRPTSTLKKADIDKLIKEINERKIPLSQMKERGQVVLADFIKSEVVKQDDKTDEITKRDLTYELWFNGHLGGKILLNIDSKPAFHITEILFGENAENKIDLVNEAMKEALNIFSGHLSSFFHDYGYEIDIGVPISSGHNILESKAALKLLFRYTSDDKPFQFFVEIDPEEE